MIWNKDNMGAQSYWLGELAPKLFRTSNEWLAESACMLYFMYIVNGMFVYFGYDGMYIFYSGIALHT